MVYRAAYRIRSKRAVMTAARKSRTSAAPSPPLRQVGPVIFGDHATIQRWLTHYWQKLHLPDCELSLLAITQDRKEYMRWTGKRLNSMALGCYCYIPASRASQHIHGRNRTTTQLQTLPSFEGEAAQTRNKMGHC